MKRVYVVFESMSNSWSSPGDYDYVDYDHKFIDVYDNFPAARDSITKWAESQQNVVGRHTDRTFEEITSTPGETPYDVDAKDLFIYSKRFITSTLLKSS